MKHEAEDRRCRSAGKIEDKYAVEDIVYPAGSDRAGEIIVESGQKISRSRPN